jgi:hypothetical protein
VRDNNDPPDEPYILYSELRDLLEDICADLCAINTLIQPIGEVLDVEIVKGMLTTLGITVGPLNESLEEIGSTKLFAAGAKINLASLPVELSPAGRLGKNEELEGVSQRGTIASTKIFGESND